MKTNGDRIRTMTDEELAERMSRIAHCWFCPVKCGIFCIDEECKAKWLSWLRSPVEDGYGNEKLLDDFGAEKLFLGEHCTDEEIELISKILRENSVETGINIYDYL